MLLSLLDKFNEMEEASCILYKMAAFENESLCRKVAIGRKGLKKTETQIALCEQLKEAKYNNQVFEALLANKPNILERFFDRDGFAVDLGNPIFGVAANAPKETQSTVSGKDSNISVAEKHRGCVHCGSYNVRKNGGREKHQMWCKDCEKAFQLIAE